MAHCESCGNLNDLIVYRIPDPHWGYIGKARLSCKACGLPDKNPDYSVSCKYVPDEHDYALGLCAYDLDWCWSAPNKNNCYDCDALITSSKMGMDYTKEGKAVFFCQGCFRMRKGVKLC